MSAPNGIGGIGGSFAQSLQHSDGEDDEAPDSAKLREEFGDELVKQIPESFRDDPSLPDAERSMRKQMSLMYLRGMTRGSAAEGDRQLSSDDDSSPDSSPMSSPPQPFTVPPMGGARRASSVVQGGKGATTAQRSSIVRHASVVDEHVLPPSSGGSPTQRNSVIRRVSGLGMDSQSRPAGRRGSSQGGSASPTPGPALPGGVASPAARRQLETGWFVPKRPGSGEGATSPAHQRTGAGAKRLSAEDGASPPPARQGAPQKRLSADAAPAAKRPSLEDAGAGKRPSSEAAGAGKRPSAETPAAAAAAGKRPSAENAAAGKRPSAEAAATEKRPSAEVAVAGKRPSAEVAAAGKRPSAEVAAAGKRLSSDAAAAAKRLSTDDAASRQGAGSRPASAEKPASPSAQPPQGPNATKSPSAPCIRQPGSRPASPIQRHVSLIQAAPPELALKKKGNGGDAGESETGQSPRKDPGEGTPTEGRGKGSASTTPRGRTPAEEAKGATPPADDPESSSPPRGPQRNASAEWGRRPSRGAAEHDKAKRGSVDSKHKQARRPSPVSALPSSSPRPPPDTPKADEARAERGGLYKRGSGHSSPAGKHVSGGQSEGKRGSGTVPITRVMSDSSLAGGPRGTMGRHGSAGQLPRQHPSSPVPLSLHEAKQRYGPRWGALSAEAKRAVLQGMRMAEHDTLKLHRHLDSTPLGLVFDASLTLLAVTADSAADRNTASATFLGRRLDSVNGVLVQSMEEVEKYAVPGEVQLRFCPPQSLSRHSSAQLERVLSGSTAGWQRKRGDSQVLASPMSLRSEAGASTADLSTTARRGVVKSTMMWRSRVGGETETAKSAQMKVQALEAAEQAARDKSKALRHRQAAAMHRLAETEDTDWAKLTTEETARLRQERADLHAFIASSAEEEQKIADELENERQNHMLTEDERVAHRMQQRKEQENLTFREDAERRRRALEARQEEKNQRAHLQIAMQRTLEHAAREKQRIRNEMLREQEQEEERLRAHIAALEAEAKMWQRQAQHGVPGAERRLAEIRQGELPFARNALEYHRTKAAAVPQLTAVEERALRGLEARENLRRAKQRSSDSARERVQRILEAKKRYQASSHFQATHDTPELRAILRGKLALQKHFEQHWEYSRRVLERHRLTLECGSQLIAELVETLRNPYERLEVLALGHRLKENMHAMQEEIKGMAAKQAHDQELVELDQLDRTLLRTIKAEEAERNTRTAAGELDFLTKATEQLAAQDEAKRKGNSPQAAKRRESRRLAEMWWEPPEEPPEGMASATYVELLRGCVADAYEQAETARTEGQELHFGGSHPLTTLPPREPARGLPFTDACWYSWEFPAGDTYQIIASLRRIYVPHNRRRSAEEAAVAAAVIAATGTVPPPPEEAQSTGLSAAEEAEDAEAVAAAEATMRERTLRSEQAPAGELSGLASPEELLRRTIGAGSSEKPASVDDLPRPMAPADFFGVRSGALATMPPQPAKRGPLPPPRRASAHTRQRQQQQGSRAHRPRTASPLPRARRPELAPVAHRRHAPEGLLRELELARRPPPPPASPERAVWLGHLRNAHTSLARNQAGLARAVTDARRMQGPYPP
eukprot:TRINITY_DN2182_c0_g2_i1.p1 TRINITY_DN2182_c0_g2~~TRINITY_DN2182_c0_g2_i1.p1  ORF type:complete len:1593 (+),score=449.63 TRINITY_DN2182_c0_g2_i1:86-4864(+)